MLSFFLLSCSLVQVYAKHLCFYALLQFVEFSGGLEGGLDPPAFQRAEKERLAKSSLGEKTSETTLVSTQYLLELMHQYQFCRGK